MKILIVESCPAAQQATRLSLQDLGFDDCHQAVDANTALSILYSDEFDFLMIDWDISDMSGIELLRVIRATGNLSTTPVLMITGDASLEQIIEAAGAGVNGYIVKPLSVQALQEKIESISTDLEAGIL